MAKCMKRVLTPEQVVRYVRFEATPPYRLLKQEGATFVGGPEVTTELIRFYVVSAQTVAGAAPATQTLGAPAAVFGGSSIPR